MTETQNPTNQYTTLPPEEELRSDILKRRARVLDGLGEFYARRYSGSQPPSHFLRAEVSTLFLALEGALKKGTKEADFNTIKSKCFGSTPEDAISGYRLIEDWLYSKGITKFDNQKKKEVY